MISACFVKAHGEVKKYILKIMEGTFSANEFLLV